MKIAVGVSSVKEAEYFLKEGAHEIYCGFEAMPSHRTSSGNFKTMAEVGEAITLAHSSGKKIFVAVNEINTDKNPVAIRCLSAMADSGLDGVIIRDLALLYILGRMKLKTCFNLSSLAQCFNLETLKFYKQFGITRVTLPQHLLPEEAGDILRNRLGVETEIFFHPRDCCTNMDGICSFTRRRYGCVPHVLCHGRFKADGRIFSMPRPPLGRLAEIFYDFYKGGADYLKISRTGDFAERKQMYKEASALIALAAAKSGKKDFLEAAMRELEWKKR